jgi:hypothetical protein
MQKALFVVRGARIPPRTPIMADEQKQEVVINKSDPTQNPNYGKGKAGKEKKPKEPKEPKQPVAKKAEAPKKTSEEDLDPSVCCILQQRNFPIFIVARNRRSTANDLMLNQTIFRGFLRTTALPDLFVQVKWDTRLAMKIPTQITTKTLQIPRFYRWSFALPKCDITTAFVCMCLS